MGSYLDLCYCDVVGVCWTVPNHVKIWYNRAMKKLVCEECGASARKLYKLDEYYYVCKKCAKDGDLFGEVKETPKSAIIKKITSSL